ncbi:hypothetical protein [Modestobacter sp. KNN46-3]|uniref:hypothetical protein n=1 Tax=Modestobacter sp. KNN46-3 TaxID=2711218 RepID=UPI0013E023E6|nr:hypothetical protein [Modestobacter sp. KNN46-3]
MSSLEPEVGVTEPRYRATESGLKLERAVRAVEAVIDGLDPSDDALDQALDAIIEALESLLTHELREGMLTFQPTLDLATAASRLFDSRSRQVLAQLEWRPPPKAQTILSNTRGAISRAHLKATDVTVARNQLKELLGRLVQIRTARPKKDKQAAVTKTREGLLYLTVYLAGVGQEAFGSVIGDWLGMIRRAVEPIGLPPGTIGIA